MSGALEAFERLMNPTELTAKEAKRALMWMGPLRGDYPDDVALYAKLKRIAGDS